MWLLFLAVALGCFYYYHLLVHYPGKLPVYPGWMPFLGNLGLFVGDTIDICEKIEKVSKFSMDNGDVVLFYLGTFPIYVLTDPDDCSQVLGACHHRPGILRKITAAWLGNGLLVGPVSVWKEHRRLINPTFNQKVLDSFLGVFNSQSRRLVRAWQRHLGGEPFDHQLSLEKNTLETVCLTTAGVDICGQGAFNDQCLQAYRDVLSGLVQRGQNPLLYCESLYALSRLRRGVQRGVARTHQLALQVLRQKREEDERAAAAGHSPPETCFKPFLRHLLDSSSKLSEKDLRDEMNNIILTGFETSSGALLFCLVLLGSHPRAQERCYREIHEIFGDSGRDVAKEDLAQLKYLEAVLKETLRLCPVVPITGRIITEDVQLKSAKLRRGHLCVLSLQGLLRHPRVWGADAGLFVPERWLEPERLARHPNAFGAFGYGRRNCIGKTYAMMTMKVTLVHVLRTYRVRGDFRRMRLKFHGVNKPADGHHVSLLPRGPLADGLPFL